VLVPTLPLGVAGGVVVAPLVGGVMSLGASLGLLAVFGLVARNGILLVSDWERSRAAGQEVSADAVIRDAASRAVPVVATAVTVAALVLPFAVSGNIAGLEELHPLAVTVLGGLVSSTVVALFVLPGLYLRFGRSQRGPLPRGWLRGLTGAHHLHRQPRGGGRHVAP
jgi:Cu/Ag efflux pump CusA